MQQFQLIGGDPALDFVNTFDNRFVPGKEQDRLGAYEDLLQFAEESGLVEAEESGSVRANVGEKDGIEALGAARELREAVAEVLYAYLDGRPVAAADLAVLEKHFKEAAQRRSLQWAEGKPVWSWADGGSNAMLPVWKLAGAAKDLLLTELIGRVRACESPTCRWLFLDNSKSHTRRWCDMKICGNRMKARRHQAKLR